MQAIPSACLSNLPMQNAKCRCDVAMQIPVKRPVSSRDRNTPSLSRRSLLCKAIYAAVNVAVANKTALAQ
jgi:hypothetical protein